MILLNAAFFHRDFQPKHTTQAINNAPFTLGFCTTEINDGPTSTAMVTLPGELHIFIDTDLCNFCNMGSLEIGSSVAALA